MAPRESREAKKRRARAIAARLAASEPEIRCPLAHRSAYELLVATILSAQCTDEMVNRVTPELFRRYPDPERLSRARLQDVQKMIRSLGLFRAKARALKRCAAELIVRHGGAVPSSMETLTGLSGVGRKTANVILGHAFGAPGIAVDTHCKRLSRRLDLTREEDPNRIERDLMELLPREEWTGFSHRLILHGRKVCHARGPRCGACLLRDLCPSRAPAAAQAAGQSD